MSVFRVYGNFGELYYFTIEALSYADVYNAIKFLELPNYGYIPLCKIDFVLKQVT